MQEEVYITFFISTFSISLTVSFIVSMIPIINIPGKATSTNTTGTDNCSFLVAKNIKTTIDIKNKTIKILKNTNESFFLLSMFFPNISVPLSFNNSISFS